MSEYSIPFCYNCFGINPNTSVQQMKKIFAYRMHNVQASVMAAGASYRKNKHLYKNKTCSFCGRSYDQNGKLDNSWTITAQRVLMELRSADPPIEGIIDDGLLKKIVAACWGSSTFLLKNRGKIKKEEWERFTFGGYLAGIITKMQNGEHLKFQQLEK